MHAQWAGSVLEEPGIHTLLMKLMSTGDDSQVLSIHEFLQADGTDWAGAGAAVGARSDSGTLRTRAVRARLQTADGTHGLLVHGVPGSVGAAAETQSKNHDDGQHNQNHGQQDANIIVRPGWRINHNIDVDHCFFILVDESH